MQDGDNPPSYIPKIKRNKLSCYMNRTSIYANSKTP